MATYPEVYEGWRADPDGFWLEAAKEIDWVRPPATALDASGAPYFYRWFADATCNTCWNAVDRHVAAGRGDAVAVIYDSPITGAQRKITFQELQEAVARLGGALQSRGVGKGDRVIVYMPMIPEAVVAMLACARIGAIHSVVFGGFAANELAVRIDDCQPKVILSASCGIEPGRVVPYKPLLDGAIEMAQHKPEHCFIYQRPEVEAALTPGRDLEWESALADAPLADCVTVGAADPLYILYTSGTTGAPKGVIRDNGGHMVALNWTMKNIYGVAPGDVFWAASDVGWVVGHSYIVYAPLVHGCTTVLFEGKPVGTPDAGVFWRVISEHNVKCVFTAPTAFRAIKRADPEGALVKDYDLSALQHLFLAGERSDADTIDWAKAQLGVPVVDHWWQTETGWTICGNTAGIGLVETPPGSTGAPMPGWDLQILDEGGQEVARGELGAVCAKLPMPPSCLPTLWNADERFKRSYLEKFPGYYETGDAGYMDENGFVFIMARTDDVINVAGHRLSTGAMEEVLCGHTDIAEAAVIGVTDALKGQLPMGFVCLNAGSKKDAATIRDEAVALVRERIGPVAAFKLVAVVDRLPKTRSGKILRGTMVKIADGQDFKMPATIDDPAILDEITAALRELGYAAAS